MKCLVRSYLIVYLAGALLACGQKGPLVLPDAPKRKHTIPALPNYPGPKQGGAKSPAPDDSSPATSPAPPAAPSMPAAPSTPAASQAPPAASSQP